MTKFDDYLKNFEFFMNIYLIVLRNECPENMCFLCMFLIGMKLMTKYCIKE